MLKLPIASLILHKYPWRSFGFVQRLVFHGNEQVVWTDKRRKYLYGLLSKAAIYIHSRIDYLEWIYISFLFVDVNSLDCESLSDYDKIQGPAAWSPQYCVLKTDEQTIHHHSAQNEVSLPTLIIHARYNSVVSISSAQGIIDWTGTETRQFFSRMCVMAKKLKGCLPLL